MEFKQEQANIIRNTISKILELTKEIRLSAPDEMKNLLFLYQTDSPKSFGKLNVVNGKVSSEWCKKMVKKYNLVSRINSELQFNFVRFRPTLITELVKKGYDFFEIQNRANHKSIVTTLKYLSKNNLEIHAKNEINKALKKIHENNAWALANQPEYATQSTCNTGKAIIYKGIVADCRNPFDPPEQVKLLKNYTPGSACGRFNMCLFCNNVLIMKHHLPMLVVYRREIMHSMGNNPNELPNYPFYKRTLDIIEHLLDPETSEFSQEDIEEAIDEAEIMDELIDGATYKPVIA
jgi:hypothetical protein